MKYISKYNNFSINESVNFILDKQDIIDIIVDIIDEGKYSLTLHSPIGKPIRGDEVHTQRLIDFIPVFKVGNIRRSKFSLSVFLKENKTYDGLIELLNEMSVVINRLKDLGWNLTNLENESSTANPDKDQDCDILCVTYVFERPDLEEEDPNFKPSKEGIEGLFRGIGLEATEIDIKFVGGKTKWIINILFDVYQAWDDEGSDEIPDDIDDKLSDLCDRIGAKEYDYNGGYEVTIYW